MEQRILAVV